jgi:hypothetical protein
VALYTLLNQAWANITPACGRVHAMLDRLVAEADSNRRSPEDALRAAAAEAQPLLDEYFAGRR